MEVRQATLLESSYYLSAVIYAREDGSRASWTSFIHLEETY